MTTRRGAVLVTVLVSVSLLSGCVAVPSSDDSGEPDPEAVFEGIFVHSDDLEDVRGEMTTTVTHGNETVTEVLEVAERPYVEYRDEVLESSDPRYDRVGDVYASNATVTWWYYAESNTAQYYEHADPFDDEAVRADRAAQAERQRELYELSYRGTDDVAGREARVLELAAANESVEDQLSVLVGDTEYVYALETTAIDSTDQFYVVEQRVWIDTEYEYPLKEEVIWETANGERVVMTERFDSVSFNEGLADETFEFEPPDDATVEKLE